VRNLKDKEHELANLKVRVDSLEQERREATQKIEFLERLNEDKNAELTRVRQANDFKRTQLDELQLQVKRVRDDAERTSSLKLNDQERKEIGLSIKVN
jgi:chromosome segregation ATPase